VPTPTTNWVLSLTRDANVARLANRETAGTEGLRHPKEHTGPLVKPSEAGPVSERSIAQNKYAIGDHSAVWARGKCSVPGRIISFLLS